MDTYNIFHEQGLSTYALDFLESSSLTPFNMDETAQRILAVMGSPYYAKQVVGSTLELGISGQVPLRPVQNAATQALHEALLQRKSTRSFNAFLSKEEVSACLLNAYFITERFEEHSHHLARRSIASGGALYPIDLFYLSLHTDGLPCGIYAYNPHFERLERWQAFPSSEALLEGINQALPADLRGSWAMDSVSGIIVFGASLNRVACKYGDRGLRFALMDVGALCHAVHMSAAACGAGCCAIGGFLDHELNRLMGFSEPNETTLLTMFLGKQAQNEES